MIGGLAGTIGLVALAKPLTDLAMKIGPPEYFALGVMALSLVSIAARGETLKGIIMACFGLMLSFIGQDPVTGSVDRFSFGIVQLASGVPTLGVFVGMFAIAQIIRMLEEGGSTVKQGTKLSLTIRDALNGFLDILRFPFTVIRAIGIGLYVGILPILGPGTAAITSYLVEKKYSREKEKFGHGVPSGLIATEVTKGCCAIGDLIPTFMLGVPGSITGGILLGAFLLHGVQAGPQFLLAGSAPYIVFAGIGLTQILIVLVGLPLIKCCSQVVKVPNALLAPILTVLCFIGAFVERNMAFDLLFLIMFGVFGYVLDRLKYSLISLIIGLIIGDMVETNLHRTLSMGYGSWYLFWTRPIAVSFFIITILFLAWPYLKDLYYVMIKRKTSKENGESSPITVVSMGEIILLSFLVCFALVMLVEAQSYSANAGLLPKLTSCAIIVFILWLIASRIFRRVPISSMRWRKPRLLYGSISWEWSVLTLIGYFLFVYVVGFLGATAIYSISIAVLLKYRNKLILVITTGGVILGVALFVRALNIIFPKPFFTILPF
jgi:putative tricarboxylic transport membrane protein